MLFAALAIIIGLYPLIYFIFDRKFGLLASKSDQILNNIFWNTGFYTHIICGGIALLIGWTQFNEKLRIQNRILHRRIGIIYVISVLLSSLSGIYIGFFATGGIVAAAGFISLGVVWFATTLTSFLSIKKGNILQHQKLMIYSYAACFAAVTLRIWLPILVILFKDFIFAYTIVAWLCWIPNLILAYFLVSRLRLKNAKSTELI